MYNETLQNLSDVLESRVILNMHLSNLLLEKTLHQASREGKVHSLVPAASRKRSPLKFHGSIHRYIHTYSGLLLEEADNTSSFLSCFRHSLVLGLGSWGVVLNLCERARLPRCGLPSSQHRLCNNPQNVRKSLKRVARAINT